MADTFSKAYAQNGMRAYAALIQEPEEANKVDVSLLSQQRIQNLAVLMLFVLQVLTHQKWSGANYADELLKMVTGGISSTAAMGAEVTETQFAAASPDIVE